MENQNLPPENSLETPPVLDNNNQIGFHKKPSFISIGLVFLSIIGFIVFGLYVFIFSNLDALYSSLNINYPYPLIKYLFLGSVLVISGIYLFWGYHLAKIQKVFGTFTKKQKRIGIFFLLSPLLLFIVLVPLLIISVINPIYTLTSNINPPKMSPVQTIKKSPTPTLTPDPTANWKTYENNEFQFSISYPPTWKKSTDPSYPFIVYAPHGLTKDPNHFVEATVIAEESNMNLREWLKGQPIGGECCPEDFVMETVSLNGQPFQKVVLTRSKFIGFISKYKGKIFYIFNDVGPMIGCCLIEENDPTFKEDLKTSEQILQNFKFTDSNIIDPTSKTSPDGMYTVTEEQLGDYNKISIRAKNGTIITKDLAKDNEKEIGYGTKFGCQCGTLFSRWMSIREFAIKITNSLGEEYEYLVDASTGKVEEQTFKKIK